jgi:hypothetical protein
MTMKRDSKKRIMTFGEFVVGAYRAWGGRRAKGLVWLAVNAGLVEFSGGQRFVITAE